MRILPALILAAASLLPVAAKAQSADPGDVRCLVTLAAAASNEQIRAQALTGVYYFAARITAREPRYDFSLSLRREADKMSRADFQSELTRCGGILRGVSQQLETAQTAMKGFAPRN